MSKKMDFREYECELIKVVDGDTIDCWIDLGFKIRIKSRVRYSRCDTWYTCLGPRGTPGDGLDGFSNPENP